MTLPLPRLDDRTWQDLRDEGVSLIPRYSPEWTDHNASDPGITLIELLAYHTELELFRLDGITTAHRRAFLGILGDRHLPNGPRHAATLLTLDPSSAAMLRPGSSSTGSSIAAFLQTGEYFVPRHAPTAANARHRPRRISGTELSINLTPVRNAGEPDEPMLHSDSSEIFVVPEFGFRAVHEMHLTGIRVAAVQSFDGKAFRDISDMLFRARSATVWGDDPIAVTGQTDVRQPAVYIGLDLSAFRRAFTAADQADMALTLWCVPDGFSAADLSSPEIEFQPADQPVAPPAPGDFAGPVARNEQTYNPARSIRPHHGLTVCWEYFTNAGWTTIPVDNSFRDETCGFTRPGRIVIPGKVMISIIESIVGIIPAKHSYLRGRLADGRPDRAPTIRGLFADAILVEQWDRTATPCRVVPPERLDNLQLAEEIEADINDAATDLGRRGWGTVAAAWRNWPLFGEQGFDSSDPDSNPTLEISEALMNAVVIGVATGEPNQRFALPCPPGNTLFAAQSPDSEDDSPSIRILTDSLQLWTLEPSWGWRPSETQRVQDAKWQPQSWDLVSDFVPGARRISHVVYNPGPTRTKSRYTAPGQIVFGDGDNGRVPPPGAIILASYSWTVAEAANFAAGFVWARSTEREPFHRDRVTLYPTLRFMNALSAEGGKTGQSLSSALYAMANEFGAPAHLIELTEQARTNTLDGLDLSGIEPPTMAVNLLDFECLARRVPGTAVARARAWAEFDPNSPGHQAPGNVTVTVVPHLPANRPEPTAGLILRVHAYLDERRPVACRVHVIGPEYVAVRVRATLHTSRDRVNGLLAAAETALQKYLHPTQGGQSGGGWPFGRDVHTGELMRILANLSHVKHVTGLQLATAGREWTEAAIEVPARSLVTLIDPDIKVLGDA